MNLGKLYTKRMIREAFSKKNLISLISLVVILFVVSLLPFSFLPFTPATKASLIRIVEDYFHLKPTEQNLSLAFFAIEFQPLVALFASTMVALIPQKLIFYERVSGNMEILLSRYGNIRSIVKAMILSSLIIAILIYGIFMISGISAIFIYELVYDNFIAFPAVFYVYSFVFAPIVVILSVSIALLLTVLFPKLSSVENLAAVTSSPLQLLAYSPALMLVLIMTFVPISPEIVAIYATPIVFFLLILTLVLAGRFMKRDVLIRK